MPRTFRTGAQVELGYLEKGNFCHARRRVTLPSSVRVAVKLVIETSRPIAQVAKELDIQEGTLGSWVARYRREHAGEEPELNATERARLRQLERETRELRMENEFLKKPPRTSPRIIGERHVRVHRRRVRDQPHQKHAGNTIDRLDVSLASACHVRDITNGGIALSRRPLVGVNGSNSSSPPPSRHPTAPTATGGSTPTWPPRASPAAPSWSERSCVNWALSPASHVHGGTA